MGANSSRDACRKGQQHSIEEYIDYGTTLPNGIYPSTQQDFDLRVVRRFICERRLAPFYKGLADPPEHTTSTMPAPAQPSTSRKSRSRSGTATSATHQPVYDEETIKPFLYNNAVECPICFLYYPANINHARCCDQPVCTECFLQMKRPVETPVEPATCPFCLEANFGVVYAPPAWTDQNEGRTAGANTTGRARVSPTMETRHTTSGVVDESQPRRKSVKHNSAEVVLVDHVRPDWEKPKQEHASAPTAPRRNSDSRGGLFRNRRSTRPNRSASAAVPPQQEPHPAHSMDFDIEEYLIMEAIRLSLQDQEEQSRRNNNCNSPINAAATGDTDHPNEEDQPTNASSS